MPEEYPSLESRRLPTQQDALKDNLLHKVMSFFAQGSGALPSPGMITVLPETLPLFTKAIDEASQTFNTGHPMVDKALAFLATRYPRFSKQVPVIAAQGGENARKIAGLFRSAHPETGETIDPFILANPKAPLNFRFEQIVNTLGHELTHARQYTKQGMDMFMEGRTGVPYAEQQIEKFANRGGDTAMKAYQKYIDLLGRTGGKRPSLNSEELSRELARQQDIIDFVNSQLGQQ